MIHYWMRRKFVEGEDRNVLHLVRSDGAFMTLGGIKELTVLDLQEMADRNLLNSECEGEKPGRGYMKDSPGVEELYVRPRWLRSRIRDEDGYLCMEAIRSDGYLYFARGPKDYPNLKKALRSKLDSMIEEIPEVSMVPTSLHKGEIGWVEE